MPGKDKAALRENSPYNAAITREQFLFYEMRTTAKLVCEGLSKEKIIETIVSDNLFQYPTEKSVRKMASACLRRLDAMNDTELVQAMAYQPSGTLIKVDELANALQVCLDSGAKKVLIPATSMVDFATVPPDLMSAFQLIPYQSAEDAVFKALGVE